MVERENVVEMLYKAGVLLTKDLSDDEIKILNSLSSDEIESLKNMKEKLGSFFIKGPGCSIMI